MDTYQDTTNALVEVAAENILLRDRKMNQITLRCRTVITFDQFDSAGLSYVPCGEIIEKEPPREKKEQPILPFAHLWGQRRHVTKKTYGKKWNAFTTNNMTGIQIMTGKPTYKTVGRTGYLYYTSLDIEHRMLQIFPETVEKIQKVYEDNVIGTPCIIKTKSNGLRLDAYTEYVGKKMSFKDVEQKMLFEVLADKCLARIDHRYAMISGSILDMPTLPKEALQEIYHLVKGVSTHEQSNNKPREVVETSQIGDLNIQWGADGRSQLFPTAHCKIASHASNRDEVRFTKYPNGSIDGFCFNCQEGWWERQPEKKVKSRHIDTYQHLTPIPPLDHVIEKECRAIERAISQAPLPQDPSRPSYPHFSVEQKRLLRADGLNPMAGYHEINERQIPTWIPKYEKLNPAFGNNDFAMNGQPQETEVHRVWNTTPQMCPHCETPTALYWIDRFRYKTGFYCDACHSDTPINSLLRLELDRKLPNHYISTNNGYVSDDPYWNTTPLWKTGQLTFLASAMNTGKTTFANTKGVELARKHSGHLILIVPRVSLAKEQHYELEKDHGKGSFGIFHEGSKKSLGRLGAVCTLSSLPNVFRYEDPITGETYDIENAWIFIDEADYSYQLLNLLSPVAKQAKGLLETALHTTGLVVAGQTEWTAVVETLATELETDQTLGYYKPVKPHEASTEIVVYPNIDGKNAWALSELIEYVQDLLDTGKHAYVFCARRRDVSVLHDIFFEYLPLTYTAYSKNTERAERFLEDGKLTDTNLFLATSAAAVGISIHDEKAHTAILGGHVHGHLNCADIVQERVRDRKRKPGRIFLPTFNTAFPVTQTDATAVSRYEAQKKRIAADIDPRDLKNADKLAATKALNSLAEDDPIPFITHHLESVAGFNVDVIKPNPPCKTAIQRVRDVTKKTEHDEKSATEKVALDVFDAEIERLKKHAYTPPHLMTTSQARKMYATQYTVLGNKKAAEIACLIGFDDLSDIHRGTPDCPIPFDWLPKDLELASQLIESSVDANDWKQRFFGYLATRNTVISNEHWGTALESGKELSAIRDYAFIGELVRRIIDTTAGKKYDTKSLTAELTQILNTLTDDGSRTYLDEIQSGAIGVKPWRKARYLNIGTSPVDFCIELTETFYPCVWRKYRDQVSIHNDEKLDLFAQALNTFLYHKRSPEMHDLDAAFGGTDKIVDVKPFPETEDPENWFYANVRKLFADGKSIDEIIEITGLSERKIYEVTKDLRVSEKKQTDMQLQTDALKMLDKGMSKRAVAETLKISRTKLNRILSP